MPYSKTCLCFWCPNTYTVPPLLLLLLLFLRPFPPVSFRFLFDCVGPNVDAILSTLSSFFVAFSIQMHFALRSPSVSCFLFYSYRFYLPLKKQTGFPHTFSFPFPHVIFCLTLPFSPSSLFSFLSVPPVVLRFALMARQILSGYFVWREVEFRWWCHDFWQLPFPLACLLFFSFSPFLMLLCCISRTLPHIFLPIN